MYLKYASTDGTSTPSARITPTFLFNEVPTFPEGAVHSSMLLETILVVAVSFPKLQTTPPASNPIPTTVSSVPPPKLPLVGPNTPVISIKFVTVNLTDPSETTSP